MNRKKMLPLAILGGAAAVLAAALAALTLLGGEETEAGIALFDFDADAVTALSYRDATGTATAEAALSKTDGQWVLDSDPALPIDQDTAETLVSSLTALAAQRELTDGDVDAMGFDAPAGELSLTTGDGEWTLTVGGKNSITGAWYARRDSDGTVYTISASALSGVTKTPRQLYAAQDITEMESDDVTGMTVTTANGEALLFAQTDGTWTLTDDADFPLNQDLVNKMANTLCALTTDWSITAPEADAAYGLDSPSVVVTLTTADADTITCTFGGAADADGELCYLRSSAAPGVVYEVDADAVDAFAYDKAALEAEEDTATAESGDVIAEDYIGGADDFADSAD